MKLASTLILLSMTTASIASTRLVTLAGSKTKLSQEIAIYGQETKFEALKNAYERAISPATKSDFEYFDADSNKRKQRCVISKEENADVLVDVIAAIVTKKVAGSTGNGPIFPRTADRNVEKVLVGQSWIGSTKNFDVFINNSTNTDFIVRVPKNDVGVYGDIGNEITFSFRKVDNYMPFKVEKQPEGNGPVFPGGKGTVLYYGYCYNK